MINLTAEQARALLRYNPETGILYWRARTPDMLKSGHRTAEEECIRWNRQFAGKEAFPGTDRHGYKTGKIFNRGCRAHRIAWLIHYGAWPANQIDHINGVRHDNRIENLRDVPSVENNRNTRMACTNTSGFPGVYPSGKKWRARIKVNRRSIGLGSFESIDAAVMARKRAMAHYGFHENHGAPKLSNPLYVTKEHAE